jgi:glycosyltransferase involved in cell wall biosynthesis
VREHVYLSSNHWSSLWIVQQPVCQEIQRDEPVLFVERFVSLFTILRYPRLWRSAFAWLRGARRLTPHLRILAPLPLFHLGHRVPWLFRVEFAIQRRWILAWLPRATGRVRVLWVDNPLYGVAIGRMREMLSVYHVADEVAAFPTSSGRHLSKLEAAVLEKVDVVFAASDQLAAAKRGSHPNTHAVWNAIDPTLYSQTAALDRLPVLDGIPAPRVAFIGVIDQWVDLGLLEAAAAELPRVRFVIVGPVRVDDARLRRLPNVHFLGRQDRPTVANLLHHCAASLVPFHRTPLTEGVLPLKIFEALAAGTLPVCSDFSPDLDRLSRDGYVHIGRTEEEFVRRVAEAVQSDDAERRHRLSTFGLNQSWTSRWMQMVGVLERTIAGKSNHGRSKGTS